MEAKELRIGNLVEDKNGFGIMQVESILSSTHRIYLHTLDQEYLADFLIETVSPIPLTEEWLVKLGFIKIPNDSDRKKECDWVYVGKMELCFDPDDNSFYMSDREGLQIKSVHQLQNLFWCLVGEELTIK